MADPLNGTANAYHTSSKSESEAELAEGILQAWARRWKWLSDLEVALGIFVSFERWGIADENTIASQLSSTGQGAWHWKGNCQRWVKAVFLAWV
jgi:hypothetical protein